MTRELRYMSLVPPPGDLLHRCHVSLFSSDTRLCLGVSLCVCVCVRETV